MDAKTIWLDAVMVSELPWATRLAALQLATAMRPDGSLSEDVRGILRRLETQDAEAVRRLYRSTVVLAG